MVKKYMPYLQAVTAAALALIMACSNPADPEDPDNGGNTVTYTDDITTNTTWESGTTYIIDNTINITSATLTIEAGTVIKFDEGASIVVGTGGGLIADGTSDTIFFTGTTAQAGWWDYIRFNSGSVNANCRLVNCVIEYGGGYGGNYGAVYVSSAAPTITGCTIRHSEYGGVYFYSAHPTLFSGNTITGCGGTPVRIEFDGVGYLGTGTYTGNGSDVIDVGSGTLEENATWLKQDVPYLVESGSIENGVLTLSAGVTVKMISGAEIVVNTAGGLIADGTSEQITITGEVAQKGYWDYIRFNDASVDANCRLINCAISYGGGYGTNYGMIYCNYASPTINGCTISSSDEYGVYFYEGVPTSFVGNTVTLCDREPVRVPFNGAALIDTGSYTGNSRDYILVSDGTLTSDATWKKQDVPYLVEDGDIENATLTIAPGTVIHMGSTAAIIVNDGGGFIADGTSETIVITGAVPQAGYWEYIRFNDDAVDANCRFTACEISYGGGYGTNYGMIYGSYASPSVTNSTLSHSGDWAIYYYQATENQSGNTFEFNALGDVAVQ